MTKTSGICIGLDFDNTIVCYDEVFYNCAFEQELIPADIPHTKSGVRGYLRQKDREDDWTRLQGYVYGPSMKHAKAFPGAIPFIDTCRQQHIPIHVISHRTRHPYLGEKYDLHEAARLWLENAGILAQLDSHCIVFEESREAKLDRIRSSGCTLFLDDLLDFLQEPQFPPLAKRVLFDPNATYSTSPDIARVKSWQEFTDLVREITTDDD